MSNPTVVIVGGGFGGVYTAKHLLKQGIAVTLISDRNYFTFTPLLHEVATGNLTAHDIIFEYSSFFKSKLFTFVRGRVVAIDSAQKQVRLNDNATIPYTYVVLATGAVTNYYSIRGVEHALELKTIDDAQKIKKSILKEAQGTRKELEISVVGAGPTGIELVLEIEQFSCQLKKYNPGLTCHIRLFNGFDKVLNSFHISVQQYARKQLESSRVEMHNHTFVEEIKPDSVSTTQGDFNSHITVLVAGVKPQVGYVPEQLLGESGHVEVTEHLQTTKDKHIFALGDIIARDGTPQPKLAQLAVNQAKVVAMNISLLLDGRADLVSYTTKVKGMLVSLGFRKGAGRVFNMTLRGLVAWFVWRTVYLLKTPGIVNKARVAFTWTLNLFTKRSLTEE